MIEVYPRLPQEVELENVFQQFQLGTTHTDYLISDLDHVHTESCPGGIRLPQGEG